MIVLEVLLIVYLFLSASTYWIVAFALTVVIDTLALGAIINMDANPEFKVTWVVVVLLLPLIGALLYVLFYRRRITRREAIHLASSFSQLNNYRESDSKLDLIAEHSCQARGKARAILNDDPISEIYRKRSRNYTVGLLTDRRMMEAVIPYFEMEDGELTHLELLPIELGFGEPRYRLGNPRICTDRGILERYAEMSLPYGTKMKINGDGIAVVELH